MKISRIILSFVAVILAITVIVLIPGISTLKEKVENAENLSVPEEIYELNAVLKDTSCIDFGSISPKDYEVDFPYGIMPSMKAAYSVNQDTVGRLNVIGTELDTVVTQSDDNDYYLRYDFFGKYTYFGNVYLDYRCSADKLCKNNILYGHTTRSGKEAFRSLAEYTDPEHFINHPIIEYSTLFKTYRFKIFAVIVSTADRSEDNCYFDYIYPYMTDKNCVGYLEQIRQRSLYETGVEVSPEDTFLTLSTCYYGYSSFDARLAVIAKLMDEGESDSVNADAVIENPDYRRPDAWYKSRGIANPYADSEPWTPSATD